MKYFKYAVEDLIKGVRDRPVIWDKTLEIYKDREERKRAWVEIFRLLDEEFNRSPNKRSIGDVIINKWTNVRDTFMRTLKKSQTHKNIKKYVHHDEMSFLLKLVPEELIPADYEQQSDDDPIASPEGPHLKSEMIDDLCEEENSAQKEPIRMKQLERKRVFYEKSPEPERRRRKHSRKSKRHSDSDENLQVDFVDTDHDPRIMNEDEAFFASLLPTIVNYSEDERLEFRIDVLAVMKNIKQKRRINKLTDDGDD